MKNKALNTLLVISIAVLIIAAFVFIFISMFNGTGSQWALQAGLICVVILNLFNMEMSRKVQSENPLKLLKTCK